MRVFAVWFIVIGLGGAILAARDLHRSRRAVEWPTAPGVVVASYLVENDGAFSPRVAYTYEVVGKKYRATDVDPAADGMGSGERRSAQKRLDRFPLKAAVTVYYNPASPAEAMLEPGVRPKSFAPPLLALACAVAGVIMWVTGGRDCQGRDGV